MDDFQKKYEIFLKVTKQDDPLNLIFQTSMLEGTDNNTSTPIANNQTSVNIANNTQVVNDMNKMSLCSKVNISDSLNK